MNARVVAGALAAMGILTSACSKAERRVASGPPPPAIAVRTAPVERDALGAASVPATVQARQRAILAARVPASIVALPFREGQAVPAQAVVVRLEDGPQRAAVSAAAAAVQAASTDLKRLQSLLARGAATQREADEAATRAAAAESRLSAARDDQAYAVLRAPFAGRLTRRHANVGDVVAPGAPLVELEGLDGLELLATVDAELVEGLHAGQGLEALVDGQSDPLTATVRAVSGAGDPATHRFEVRADLPERQGLRSGLFGRLSVPRPGATAALYVPKAAVFERGGLSGLFVAQQGHARLRWVAPGRTLGERLEIRAGVQAGEQVVLDPAELADGAPISIAAPVAPSR